MNDTKHHRLKTHKIEHNNVLFSTCYLLPAFLYKNGMIRDARIYTGVLHTEPDSIVLFINVWIKSILQIKISFLLYHPETVFEQQNFSIAFNKPPVADFIVNTICNYIYNISNNNSIFTISMSSFIIFQKNTCTILK